GLHLTRFRGVLLRPLGHATADEPTRRPGRSCGRRPAQLVIDARGRSRQTAPVAVTFRSACLVAVTLLLTVACAPAQQAPAPQAGSACPPGGLPTLKQGTLTFGTDQPVYPPWFVDDKPESGQGFEGAVAAAIADGL